MEPSAGPGSTNIVVLRYGAILQNQVSEPVIQKRIASDDNGSVRERGTWHTPVDSGATIINGDIVEQRRSSG